MLMQIWERLRGFDRWKPTQAIIRSSILEGVDLRSATEADKAQSRPLAWQSICKIAWQDQNGIEHVAEFEAYEESPLYQLCEGDQLEIRVNPKKPSESYLPGLLQSRLMRTSRLIVFAVLFALVGIAILVAWFGPEIMRVFSHGE